MEHKNHLQGSCLREIAWSKCTAAPGNSRREKRGDYETRKNFANSSFRLFCYFCVCGCGRNRWASRRSATTPSRWSTGALSARWRNGRHEFRRNRPIDNFGSSNGRFARGYHRNHSRYPTARGWWNGGLSRSASLGNGNGRHVVLRPGNGYHPAAFTDALRHHHVSRSSNRRNRQVCGGRRRSDEYR